MGSWTLWHFVVFIAVALAAAWRAHARRNQPTPEGFGGWLAVLCIFLVFWGSQELAELYRIRHEIAVLVPSAAESPEYRQYALTVLGLTWFEAIALIGSALLLGAGPRQRWVPWLATVALWLAGPLASAAEFLAAQHYVGDFLLEEDYSAISATTLFATTWTWYLLASRRVACTFTPPTA